MWKNIFCFLELTPRASPFTTNSGRFAVSQYRVQELPRKKKYINVKRSVAVGIRVRYFKLVYAALQTSSENFRPQLTFCRRWTSPSFSPAVSRSINYIVDDEMSDDRVIAARIS